MTVPSITIASSFDFGSCPIPSSTVFSRTEKLDSLRISGFQAGVGPVGGEAATERHRLGL